MSSPSEAPFDREVIDRVLAEHQIDPATAAIRRMTQAVADIEKRLDTRFLRMEFGIPGLTPPAIGIEAEMEALRQPNIPGQYAPVVGHPGLKAAVVSFVKAFLDIETTPGCVMPTVGAMQAGFLSQALSCGRYNNRDSVVIVTPCFSVHRTQARFLGLKEVLIDLYERDTWLDRVEADFAKGKTGAIIYSSPSNPSWVILAEPELKRLGELCTKYDVVAIEDVAYFGMDFRHDYSVPGRPPYPPTVARHTENHILAFSGSKIFNYAGQRVGFCVVARELAGKNYPDLVERFEYPKFINAFLMSGVYCTSSGVSHSAQHALEAMLNKAVSGEFKFLEPLRVYGERAKALKEIMLSNGFELVYAEDLGEPLSDGFFFTFCYPGMDGTELVRELLYYGISATTLDIAGSTRKEAVRACTSLIPKEDFALFERRIKAFRNDHPIP